MFYYITYENCIGYDQQTFFKRFMVIQKFKDTYIFIHLAQLKFNILKCFYYIYGNRLFILKY